MKRGSTKTLFILAGELIIIAARSNKGTDCVNLLSINSLPKARNLRVERKMGKKPNLIKLRFFQLKNQPQFNKRTDMARLMEDCKSLVSSDLISLDFRN